MGSVSNPFHAIHSAVFGKMIPDETQDHDQSDPSLGQEVQGQAQKGTQAAGLPPAEIHIGIDFGTSFTKACYYLLDKDTRRIVTWNPAWKTVDPFFFPSAVWIDLHDVVSIASPGTATARRAPYLKMAVANYRIGQAILPRNTTCRTDAYHLYSAFFLAHAFAWIEKFARETGGSYLKNRSIDWSGSIGIPVSYKDSDLEAAFDEILHVARTIYRFVRDSESVSSLDTMYQDALGVSPDPKFTTVPELHAEASGLFSDFRTPEGHYAIFDIGGGTVDGSVMLFTRPQGRPHVNFLTSRVDALGVEIIADRLRDGHSTTSDEKAHILVFQQRTSYLRNTSDLAHAMRQHTAEVIVRAKEKSTAAWRTMRELPVLVCGGGRSSGWHRHAIKTTYTEHQHSHCGIPPYAVQDLRPEIQGIDGITQETAHRFLIAIGLSVPEGYGPTVDFPSSNPAPSHNQDCRDNLDDIQKEKYGD